MAISQNTPYQLLRFVVIPAYVEDVDNYFMLLEGCAQEEGEEEPQPGPEPEPESQEAGEAADAELGWAVDTNADTSRDVALDIGDTDFEEYAADLEAQAQLQMEAEVDAEAELALAEEDVRAQELAQEAADMAAAFGVEDEVPNFGMMEDDGNLLAGGRG
ncbi:ANK3 [Symbiodinium pilosum]|uniref:ANK3 protein n=1 Tax=Symbiodinium pilosum TaxID=2952 RepID=A0A812RTP4_SYMPI|nr:ANK3 [Symbiodinium pilosum]